ncbi:MAG: aminoacyl-tRNA hydrolase [Deltaproteobacteria bacterium]|nr:aminoacyl-tRNA hydrolase [Deltaproteobacteria bacterium]
MEGSFLLVGLGNPGSEYANTRHNIGAMLLEYIAQQWHAGSFRKKYDGFFTSTDLGNIRVNFLFPQTYMNLSGNSVKKAFKNSNITIDRLIILHDEADLEFGKMKIKVGGGLAGHNGLRSISQQLGTNDFIRIRLGVGRPASSMTKHVLGRFSQLERTEIKEIFDTSLKAVEALLLKGPSYAMNTFNGL